MFYRKALEEVRDMLTDSSIEHVAVRVCKALERIDEMILNEDTVEEEIVYLLRRAMPRFEQMDKILANIICQQLEENKRTENLDINYAVTKNGNPL
jgi:hypothetical protein